MLTLFASWWTSPTRPFGHEWKKDVAEEDENVLFRVFACKSHRMLNISVEDYLLDHDTLSSWASLDRTRTGQDALTLADW